MSENAPQVQRPAEIAQTAGARAQVPFLLPGPRIWPLGDAGSDPAAVAHCMYRR